MIVRNLERHNTLAHAFDEWCLNNVALLIDAVADGKPPHNMTWHQLRELARLDLRMLPRLVKLGQAILDKYDRGELTQAEARHLSGSDDEEIESCI